MGGTIVWVENEEPWRKNEEGAPQKCIRVAYGVHQDASEST